MVQDIGTAALVSIIPAGTMLLGSFVAIFITSTNHKFQACMQNVSGGIILGAVAIELFPLLDDEGGASLGATVGLLIGFLAGLLLFFGLKKLTDDGDDEEEEEEDEDSSSYQTSSSLGAPLAKPQNPGALKAQMLQIEEVVGHLQEHLQRPQPDKFAIDKHVHELHHYIDNARRHLRGQARSVSAVNKEDLNEKLAQLRNLTANATACLDRAESTGQEVDAYVARLEEVTYTLELVYDDWKPYRSFRRWSAWKAPPADAILSEKLPWSMVFAVESTNKSTINRPSMRLSTGSLLASPTSPPLGQALLWLRRRASKWVS